ncbi:MAG TPA: MlaD family protein [Solirubrobacterales bacterium]|nr:MlaD family protein [Solirubrobacterales bacterium]
MRRIAIAILALLATGASLLVTSAGAEDSHTYRVELDNAFGLVQDSEVRVAGVLAGVVKDLDVNEAKRAVVTVEVSGPLSTFKESATCTSQPQSLIAEYFLDCQPGHKGKDLPDDGLVPVHSEKYGDQTFTTVQNDLVNNTLRQPYKERFALIFNEFGTALAGNAENLNAAIRRGAPALQALRQALAILARQNRVIRDLNVNSDRVIGRLTERRGDVVDFIRNANAASTASAERRADLARNFELLPGFLSELRPSLAGLGNLAEQQTPLLTDLRVAAPQLNRLTQTLPPFNDASEPAIRTLGDASVIGRRALTKSADEIRALRAASQNSYTAANQLANFVIDLDDPRRAVESDRRAAEETGRPQGTGYTGLEGLLNYVYYQTGAINQFDEIGHLLHFIIFEFEAGPCGSYNAEDHVPARGGGETTSAANKHRCVSWVGPNQPGINQGVIQRRYDPSVCPDGSANPELCRPANARQLLAARRARGDQSQASLATGDSGDPSAGLPGITPPDLPDLPGTPQSPVDDSGLGGLLGVDNAAGGDGIPSLPGDGRRDQGAADPAATGDLLDYLFGN